MITLDEFSEVPLPARGGFLAVGNFDGVHEGHTRLIRRLRANADRAGAPAIALTFDPHPIALLRPEQTPLPLVWTERKVELLKRVGATEVVVFKTGPWLLRLAAREFFTSILVGKFAARGMVEGPNFAFGRDRGGDATLLAAWCAEAALQFEVVAPTEMDGGLISSTRIRLALAQGRIDDARRWLGHPHAVRGIVTHGAARGAGLGFPTANLAGVDTLIPEDGVYATRAFLDGAPPGRPSATHIGPNITFGEQTRNVEAHLIGFSGDLYGKTIVLEFLDRLRPSRTFTGLDGLRAQIQEDVSRASWICAREET